MFFQKPTKNELILAVLMYLAYIVYSSIFTNLLGALGIPDVGNSNVNIVTIVSLIFSMMAEERRGLKLSIKECRHSKVKASISTRQTSKPSGRLSH